MSPPPMMSEEKLREMDRDSLVEYAMDRQDAAYGAWEQMMGDDL